jgi:hypothetical protein
VNRLLFCLYILLASCYLWRMMQLTFVGEGCCGVSYGLAFFHDCITAFGSIWLLRLLILEHHCRCMADDDVCSSWEMIYC